MSMCVACLCKCVHVPFTYVCVRECQSIVSKYACVYEGEGVRVRE